MHTFFQSVEQVFTSLRCGSYQHIDDVTLLLWDRPEVPHRPAKLRLQPEGREMIGEPREQEGTGLVLVRRCS